MKVLIPSALHSYTGGARTEAQGATLAEAMIDLDRRHPGIRFRMIDEHDRVRRHIRIFSGGQQIFDLTHPLPPDEELIIVQALSGG